MAKDFVLVDKVTHKKVYSGQIFHAENDNPLYMLGGDGQIMWYWCDVTGNPNISEGQLKTVETRTPPGGETIDAQASNVIVSGGTWA